VLYSLKKTTPKSHATIFLNLKICILQIYKPKRAKMKMKRQSKTSRATMEEMEFTRDFTRLPMADQYLNN
jgi:hypothetical protein